MQQFDHWSIDRFIDYARNPRKNDHAVDSIASAIKEFGFRVPVVVQSDGTVVDGHLRLKAARKLGIDEIPVLLADDMTDAQIKAFRLSVNKMAELADWNTELLSLELEELQGMDFDLDLTGFDADFILPEEPEGLTDEDAVPEAPEEPVTVEGDIWVLGDHRVMCGDSTDKEQVEQLMDGEKADITFTSPPYNLGSNVSLSTRNKKNNAYLNYDDNALSGEYLALLEDSTLNSLSVSQFVFVNVQSLAGNKKQLIEFLFNMRDYYADVMVWTKSNPQPAMAENVLNSAFEFIHIFSGEKDPTRAIGTIDFRGSISNVYSGTVNSENKEASIHSAAFPLSFAQYFIECFAVGSTYEPFLGTGTTLIACEKTNRKCYGMELDPKYCDVIIQRWQDFTGKSAILERTGQSFNEIKEVKPELHVVNS